jgi:ABC-type multidrug transport system ATPase subunit
VTVSTGPAVSVQGLTKDFGDGSVFEGLEFEIPEEKITLMMGPNGVGKTILLSCIAGGLYPDEGEVAVFGADPETASAAMSFMLQDAMLVDELTGRENAAFFRDLHPRATGEWQTILEALSFDMDALDREVNDYSGGMKRKVELAITLSVDTQLSLLDEPTAALDVTTVETLHSMLSDRREAGETILMSSHLPTDAGLADRIVFLTESGLVAEGSPAELLDDVPEVVHIEGTADDVDDFVRHERLFESDVGRRGFLREDVEAETVESGTDEGGGRIEVREPTHVDLFNFYVHVADDQQ